MTVCNSPDIFQENISELFYGFDMLFSYIDYVLVIAKNNFKDHLKALDMVLQRLAEARLKVNAEKFFFGRTETEYLGFFVIYNRLRPLLSQA